MRTRRNVAHVLRALPAHPHPAGLAIVVLGILLLTVGQFGAERFLMPCLP